MKKWSILLAAAVLAFAGWFVAGPFLAVNAIRSAIETQDSAALSRHVDFPALRSSLRAQMEDYLARQLGDDLQNNALGAIALQVAGQLTGSGIDAAVSPAGIGALLEGRNLLQRISGGGIDRNDSYAHAPPPDPLRDARYRFESLSRFTATVADGDGQPVVFVFTLRGMRWRLSDIRLPR